MITLTSEISKLSTTGLLLEESLQDWKKGKVSKNLFRACNSSCPYELMSALSWIQNDDEIEIGVLALKTDDTKTIIEADPFILYDGDKYEISYT
jgi:hypothetical protein